MSGTDLAKNAVCLRALCNSGTDLAYSLRYSVLTQRAVLYQELSPNWRGKTKSVNSLAVRCPVLT
eukprot:219-Rhodomonas_salina.4